MNILSMAYSDYNCVYQNHLTPGHLHPPILVASSMDLLGGLDQYIDHSVSIL